MENNTEYSDQGNTPFKVELPNATAVLVLGILSIVFCWCIGIPGLTMGIIALVLSKNSETQYSQNPAAYTETSYKNLSAGKICAIIGTSLSGVYILLFIVKIIFFGTAFNSLMHIPWDQIR